MTSFSLRERDALCDLALDLGPEAPTLCEGWRVRDLLEHLVTREQPWRLVPRLSTPAAELAYDDLVARVRRPAGYLRTLPALDAAANTVELFVHHEDVRRAQPGWTERVLPAADQDALWKGLGVVGRVLAMRAGVPLVVTDGARTRALRRGDDPVTVRGHVSELVLFLFGRGELGELVFEGADDRVAELKTARRGF